MKEKKPHQIIILIAILIILIIILILFSYKIYNLITQTKEIGQTEIIKSENNEQNEILVTTVEENGENEVSEENIETLQTKIEAPILTASNGDTYSEIAVLNIPSLGIKYEVLSQTTEALMKISLTKYWGPEPNEVGNYCIVGHNYRNGKMFGKLNELENGDIIELQDMTGRTIEYKVYNKYVVEPTDTSCTSQLTNGRKELTLITCTNYGTQRLVVKCTEV